MYSKLERTKVLRDPLYGYITVDYKIISDLIDSKEFQRLRRIRQLAGVGQVFQTAEHSRFTHSLGAYHMASLVIQNVEGMEVMSQYERLVFLVAALLHDVGHGPFSHAFENVMSATHEDMTIKIILSPLTEINKILSVNADLANDVASVIRHDGRFPLIEALVSSQLDVDRMDYLSRDAYMTGAAYGHIDYFRILRSMKIVDNKVLVRASGVHSIESYLMSRYHMYFQVYYHPTARSYECVLEAIYERIKDLYMNKHTFASNISSFLKVIENPDDIISYIDLDDSYVNGFIKQMTKSKDKILNKLCNAFLNRKLFKVVDLTIESDPEVVKEIESSYPDDVKKYYCMHVSASGVAYMHSKKSDINDIKVLLPNGDVKSLDQYSPIIRSLRSSSYKEIERIYYFEDKNE